MKKSFLLFLIAILFLFSCNINRDKTFVKIETTQGNIILELYADKAPISVANFLTYIEQNRFADASFYRVVTQDNQPNSKVKIEVIQGGLFEDNHPDALAPIEHENTKQTGILHKDGVISMARYGPGSATIEFFICVGDQPSLDFGGSRNGDGHGFAAFGKVVEGMDVVRKIQKSPSHDQYLKPRIKILNVSSSKNMY